MQKLMALLCQQLEQGGKRTEMFTIHHSFNLAVCSSLLQILLDRLRSKNYELGVSKDEK